MWHAVTPVSSGHDPILCESPEEKEILVLNAGPGIVFAKAWSTIEQLRERPSFQLELRPGDQRVISGKLIRVTASPPDFAAVAWRVLSKE